MKRYLLPATLIAAVALLLPWLAVTCLPGDAGMAASFLLFFAANPLLAIGIGVLAGRRREWWWPLAVAAAFPVGAWLVFTPWETAFLMYASIYLALGMAAMLLTGSLSKER